MQKLVIVLALMVTCSLAAPVETSKEPSQPVDLIRPSPINPDIPSDPKPEEKITLITDPKVQPLTSPKPTRLPGPYVLPKEPLLRAKREDKDSSESDEEENSSEEKKKSSRPTFPASPASLIEKNAAKLSTTPVPSTTHPSAGTSTGVDTSSSTPSGDTPTHPKIPYSPQIHQHNEHLFKRSTAAYSNGSSSTSTSTTVAPSQHHGNDKRDIPVPLTPKYHHNDDHEDTKHKEELSSSSAAKVPKEEINQEEEKNEGHKTEPVDQHPATIARPIPVAELFAKKPSTE